MPLWCCYKFIARIRSVLPRMDFDIGIPAPKQWLLFLKELFGEFLGTFWIVFFGCGSAQAPALAENDVVQISLAFGLAVFIGVHLMSGLSGGHLNPAVTLGLCLTGRCKPFKAFAYMFAQCLGGIVGAAILYAITPKSVIQERSLGINKVYTVLNESCITPSNITCIDTEASVTEWQGLLVEIITTMVLVLIVLNLTDPAAEQYWSPPLIVGLTVSLCHVLAIPYTGCSVNPARSLGPSVITGLYPNHWIFWIGPFSGAILATIIHLLVFRVQNYNVDSDSKITSSDQL